MNKIRWKEYNRIYMEFKRCNKDSSHFRDINNWKIKWRDIDEDKLFTWYDKFYANNWDNPNVSIKRQIRLKEEYKIYKEKYKWRIIQYNFFCEKRRNMTLENILEDFPIIWWVKKLTEEQIIEANKKHKEWYTWLEVCNMYNVSYSYFNTNKI